LTASSNPEQIVGLITGAIDPATIPGATDLITEIAVFL
jgi:hypothetical protein